MILANIVFYTLATVLILSALIVVSSRNSVYSVLSLILAFFTSAGLFLMLGAEFIAMLMIIVYVGAVAVLFLFIVMMLNINTDQLKSSFINYLPAAIITSIVMLIELILVTSPTINTHTPLAHSSSPIPDNISNTHALGSILYTDYLYTFQISGLILFLAMVGAIVLTLRTRPGVKKQDISKQTTRSRHDSIEVVKVQSRKGV